MKEQQITVVAKKVGEGWEAALLQNNKFQRSWSPATIDEVFSRLDVYLGTGAELPIGTDLVVSVSLDTSGGNSSAE